MRRAATYLAVVCRLTTRRNVYDVFNRPPRAYTVPLGHSASRPLCLAGRFAGLPISLTITAPICSSATFSVLRASFEAAHKLYHRTVLLVYASRTA